MDEDVRKGQAAYTKALLFIYDLLVLKISNTYIWKCPTKNLISLYNANLTNNHLDVGVGTGYYLKNCNFPENTRLVLMDLNKNSLNVAAENAKDLKPVTFIQNILEPIQFQINPFDSISINYLLHCLPGTISEKSIVFDNLLPILNKNGVIFGSTILQGNIKRSKKAQKLMDFYNKKGIFSNENDTYEDLEENLKKRFDEYTMKIIGCVCLFKGIKK
ncbi:class I SAM-dependent methyltransferase [Aureivirga marina]|uniref:class I SAM-dependent methyltransferase n=1 Tax=Aureivirga marina TaxID=1182451 RepID=UPI0018C99B8D|nr:class I SAM-dependent methyltransferase [Aureivirga marina]